jgi:pimeloyl-ACP methyl ester carboxylesterase
MLWSLVMAVQSFNHPGLHLPRHGFRITRYATGPLALGALLTVGLSILMSSATADEAGKVGLLQDEIFSEYSPLSSNLELARRSLTPLTAAELPQRLAQLGKGLSEQPINLADERFTLYVPSQAPPNGYALLVFVPPWQDAHLPQGWTPVLDRYGVIFASAARSGNPETILGRREPLAVLAAQNVMHRYSVDPQRVYVAGFSGGSRIALRTALAYPDLFHGALLNSGSDPIGTKDAALPPRDLFLQFQGSTRLVYVTGDEDNLNRALDAQSMRSMRQWCVFNVDSQTVYRTGHSAAPAAALSEALQTLFKPASADAAKLAACRADIESQMAATLDHVESLFAGGKREEAQKKLREADARFGGLAAPRSTELAQR